MNIDRPLVEYIFIINPSSDINVDNIFLYV